MFSDFTANLMPINTILIINLITITTAIIVIITNYYC